MNKINVLVIDDEDEYCKVVKLGLEATRKFQVITSTDAKEGLLIAERQKPDVILLDIMMPEMTGTEIAEQLLESGSNKDIPIIFVTALLIKGEEINNQNRYHIMAKPVSIPELTEQIEYVIKSE
ncbi:MAG: Polar-differentiation response regulator DivK [Smithella sp. PtaU1.Bin162]|nr:MAG: Polar-differentiation response regulator DivK [Smithella sp. PtaU1.Bin162]